MSKLRAALLIGVSVHGFGIATTGSAQQAPGPAMPSAAARDGTDAAASGPMEDILVTARRTSERLQDVPIAVTAVTNQALRDLSVRDIMELQKVAPGLTISSQASSGRAKFAIRGQTEADSRLNTDGSVGVYIDGVNIPRNYGTRSSFIDIAQVEVLKGPQGTLYGKNTTGGALNITNQKNPCSSSKVIWTFCSATTRIGRAWE